MILLDAMLYAAILSILLPLIILWSKYYRQPLSLKWLAIFLAFSFTSDLVSTFLRFVVNPNTITFGYVLFSTGILSIFFYNVIGWKKLKKPLVFVNSLYFVFALLNVLYLQKSAPNTYSITFQVLLILFLSILYFYKLLKELPTQQLHRLPFFWIISGFFFTYSGKLVVYTVTNYLILIADDLIIIWTLHNFLTIIANLLIGYGAWLNHKQLKSTSSSL